MDKSLRSGSRADQLPAWWGWWTFWHVAETTRSVCGSAAPGRTRGSAASHIPPLDSGRVQKKKKKQKKQISRNHLQQQQITSTELLNLLCQPIEWNRWKHQPETPAFYSADIELEASVGRKNFCRLWLKTTNKWNGQIQKTSPSTRQLARCKHSRHSR